MGVTMLPRAPHLVSAICAHGRQASSMKRAAVCGCCTEIWPACEQHVFEAAHASPVGRSHTEASVSPKRCSWVTRGPADCTGCAATHMVMPACIPCSDHMTENLLNASRHPTGTWQLDVKYQNGLLGTWLHGKSRHAPDRCLLMQQAELASSMVSSCRLLYCL